MQAMSAAPPVTGRRHDRPRGEHTGPRATSGLAFLRARWLPGRRMTRLRALLAVVGPALPACFVDPGGEDPQKKPTTGASSSSDTGASTPASTGEDPTTGEDPGPRCGDGTQDPDEQCDLGEQSNGVDGAFCRADCTTNLCGDGYLASNEGCDDGNFEPGDGCSAACTLEACGDGVVGGREQCDDGNAVATDACTNLCQHAICGDGFVHEGVEECEPGDPRGPAGCTESCALQLCGDGQLGPGEQCDDGNLVDLDGCSAACVPDARRVFVTSERYPGDFGGLVAADQICQALALAAGLTGDYKAWLSDAEQGAAARLEHSPLPYVLVDGSLVAQDWADLTDAALLHPIDVDENGQKVVGGGCQQATAAWTSTKFTGAPVGEQHCLNWQVARFSGRAGELGALGNDWTNSCTLTCASQLHLYCFEQGA